MKRPLCRDRHADRQRDRQRGAEKERRKRGERLYVRVKGLIWFDIIKAELPLSGFASPSLADSEVWWSGSSLGKCCFFREVLGALKGTELR